MSREAELGGGGHVDAVGDDVDARGLDAEVLLDLRGGELGDGDDGVAMLGGLAGLFSEAGAEVGGGVVSGHYEQVMEGRDGAARGGVHALVEGVEEVGAGSAHEQAAAGVGRQRVGEGFEEAVGAIVEAETFLEMRASETEHHLAGIHADSGEISSEAVGGVEGDASHSQAMRK